MAKVTSQARFAALQWKRGTGYWGAHTHKGSPCPWADFRRHFADPVETVKAKYVQYLLSWILHHGRQPEPEEISSKAGEEILDLVHDKVLEEARRVESMNKVGAKR